jgi:uncharacterized protein YjbJ (UPF0337 family)
MKDHDRDRDVGRELGDELRGVGNQVKGKIKEETGDLLNDRSAEVEGKVEKNLGRAQRGMANPTDAMSQEWDEDVSGQPNRGSDIGGRDRTGNMGRERSSGSDLERSSGDRDRGGSERPGHKDRSGY